jgi:hypothetical protein
MVMTIRIKTAFRRLGRVRGFIRELPGRNRDLTPKNIERKRDEFFMVFTSKDENIPIGQQDSDKVPPALPPKAQTPADAGKAFCY